MSYKIEVEYIRDLAKKTVEYANLPEMAEKKQLWKAHNSLNQKRPMLLVFPECAWNELLPEKTLRCEDNKLRTIEKEIKMCLYQKEHFKHDLPIETDYVINKCITDTGWGLDIHGSFGSKEGQETWGNNPVINSIADLEKLNSPIVHYDHKKTMEEYNYVGELIGDIMNVKLKGIAHISFHLMQMYIGMRGFENMFYDLVDNPTLVHRTMEKYVDGYKSMLAQYEDMGLLSLNNDITYHSTGGVGYTDQLPGKNYDQEKTMRYNMWGSAESQEMSVVSPAMHYEFAMQYEAQLLDGFPLTGYGCCEALDKKLDYVFRLPGIRRISVSPWADVKLCAEKFEDKYIYSWKPQPAMLCSEYNIKDIKKYVKNVLDVTKNNQIEIILKDTVTCDNHPERFDNWTETIYNMIMDYAK